LSPLTLHIEVFVAVLLCAAAATVDVDFSLLRRPRHAVPLPLCVCPCLLRPGHAAPSPCPYHEMLGLSLCYLTLSVACYLARPPHAQARPSPHADPSSTFEPLLRHPCWRRSSSTAPPCLVAPPADDHVVTESMERCCFCSATLPLPAARRALDRNRSAVSHHAMAVS